MKHKRQPQSQTKQLIFRFYAKFVSPGAQPIDSVLTVFGVTNYFVLSIYNMGINAIILKFSLHKLKPLGKATHHYRFHWNAPAWRLLTSQLNKESSKSCPATPFYFNSRE